MSDWNPSALPPVELWGGVECTLNRVRDRYFDQLRRTGHQQRLTHDLTRFAELGIQALRVPVRWESTAPNGLAAADWAWADACHRTLRDLGIRPIVGLVHHGSGPSHTHLLDPGFVQGLAAFAGAVAQRYPWVTDYTPINEPVTTARFSALYGLWYPHRRSLPDFAQAVYVQSAATAAAMAAVRRVQPAARLVQTEDGGTVFARPAVQAQADFENHRQWLFTDVLCGRFLPGHPLWDLLSPMGPGADAWLALAAKPAPPQVVGLNYYLTSDRWLDERVERYPGAPTSRLHNTLYADVEAVRARPEGILGHAALLQNAYRRLGIPVALTEVHLGCTREEQLRWLQQAWDGAQHARAAGAEVVAFTPWALLGSHDWDSLVTRDRGNYECGVFDIRSPQPRPTALASAVADLARSGRIAHPTAHQSGWWQRRIRLLPAARTPQAESPAPHGAPALHLRPAAGRPLLVTGRTGTLGQAFARIADVRGLPIRLTSRAELDIADAAQVAEVLRTVQPWAVVNTAGYVRVDDAEHEPERCHRENAAGPALLAAACADLGIPLLSFSSDLVFDGRARGNGRRRKPYFETDLPRPLNCYGRTKLAGEQAVLAAHERNFVVRTSAFFGPWDSYHFLHHVRQRLLSGLPVTAAADQTVSHTFVPDLVHHALDLLIDGANGVWHLANAGACSWAQLARRAARHWRLPEHLVLDTPGTDAWGPAVRPAFSALASQHGSRMPPLRDALARYCRTVATQHPVPTLA